jgi:hypothetical protein
MRTTHLSPSYQEEKTLIYLVKVARKLKEGPKTPSELKSDLKIPAKSLYRVLSCLEAIGVVRKGVDGKYRFEDWQVFLDEEQYGVKLNHSRELIKPLLERSEIDVRLCDLSNKHLIQHLRSGYPEIYSKYELWRKCEESRKEARRRFEDLIREYVGKAGFEIVDYVKLEVGKKQISHLIFDVVEAYVEHGDFEKMRVVWKEGKVWDEYRGAVLAREEKYTNEVKELISSLVVSANVQSTRRDIEKAENDYFKAESDYKEELMWLALKVKHGEPLKGHCDLCPRIVIERK